MKQTTKKGSQGLIVVWPTIPTFMDEVGMTFYHMLENILEEKNRYNY